MVVNRDGLKVMKAPARNPMTENDTLSAVL